MAKIILSIDDRVLREVSLSKSRMTIGRAPHNDIVIDDLAISGEHAVIVSTNSDAYLEDLNSTNGTKVNGQPVKKHYLQHQDCIELAPYQLHYVADGPAKGANWNQGVHAWQARLKVLSGIRSGNEIAISKAITTIGKQDLHTAVILCRADGYYLAHVEGGKYPLVNGMEIGAEPRKLNDHDVIDIFGDRVQFLVGA